MSKLYKIIRLYGDGRSRIVKRGLTLEEAKKWCSRPDTSSRTCTPAVHRRRGGGSDHWFDRYYE
jgi:hypothetical protein